jgi:hypothetical protein
VTAAAGALERPAAREGRGCGRSRAAGGVDNVERRDRAAGITRFGLLYDVNVVNPPQAVNAAFAAVPGGVGSVNDA